MILVCHPSNPHQKEETQQKVTPKAKMYLKPWFRHQKQDDLKVT
jgi:hypothetical protein